jgi:hypothetical protein
MKQVSRTEVVRGYLRHSLRAWAGRLLILSLPLVASATDNEPPPGFVALFNGSL